MSDKKKYDKVKFSGQNGELTWVCINNPTEKEIDQLRRNFKFHPLNLEDCLSEIQRPKIDDGDDYLFIVLNSPIRRKTKRYIINDEINIFVGQNYLVTLHFDNQVVKNFFHKCKVDKEERAKQMSKGSGFLLYSIIDGFFDAGFPLMDELSKQMNELEKDVFENSYSKDRLKDILMIKKDIINFRRIIIPQRAIIAQLEHKNKKFLPENLDVYFDDVVDKIEKMWNNLENLQELIASLQETNESIINHNTNNIIKTLTVFSVCMLPLNFITGFYGMNLASLPFANHASAVTIVSGVIFLIGALTVAFLSYKKWI